MQIKVFFGVLLTNKETDKKVNINTKMAMFSQELFTLAEKIYKDN